MTLATTLTATGDLMQDNAVYYALGFAAMLITSGIFGLALLQDRAAARMRALSARGSGGTGLTRTRGARPEGLLKSLVPDDEEALTLAQVQLAAVGWEGVHAVRNFFLLRLGLALGLPALFGVALGLGALGLLPQGAADGLAGLSALARMQVCAVAAAAGFYGPAHWLKGRVAARIDRIRKGFPNALDLLQISVESGMGFDAALARVGTEIGRVAPEIAYELLLTQHEIQAGRDRAAAMDDMARRMGIAEAASFVRVVMQSMQFGTSLTLALRVYAADMRQMRELAAQEKANKLPVHMSAVMSMMMLPALFLITLTPIIIRYTALF